MSRITTHPGEILCDEFMTPSGLGANALARARDVPPNRITSIIAVDNPAPSRRTRRCAWRAISEPGRNFGSICSRRMSCPKRWPSRVGG